MRANSKQELQFHLATTVVLLLAFICTASRAAFISKADNSDSLNLSSSWVGGIAPGATDVAVWDSSTTSGNATSLGANLTWRGISIVNPAAPVSIGPGNTLTLGPAGVDMSNATQDLSLASNLTLQPAQLQTWNIASGHSLTLNTGQFIRSPAAGLFIPNNGGSILTTNITNSNSIVGPWAFISSPGSATASSSAGFTYARVSGGAIIPFTNATTAASVAWSTLNPSTNNYDLTGGAGSLASSRIANTIRYVGAGVTQNLSAVLTLNGLMNSGTGQLTFGPGSSSGRLAVGTFNSSELILNAANAPLRIDVPIQNSTDNIGAIAVYGASTVTLTGASTYTGATTIFGTLQLGTGGTTGILATTQDIVDNGQFILNHSDSITIANNITGTGVLTKTGTGTVSLAGTNSYTGPTTVSQGKLTFASSYIPLSNLTIADGASASVAQNGSRLLSVSNLSLSGSASLDLADNDMIVPYTGSSPIAAIGQLLKSGYNAGAWNGPGINSSSALTTPFTTLGYGEATDVGITSLDGKSISGTAVVVKFTYAGDSSLDGKVDLGNDFPLFLQGFLSHTASTWETGDYNYDGVTNLADFTMFLDAYKAQGSALGLLDDAILSTPDLSASQRAQLLTFVPEPTSLAFPILTLAIFSRRQNLIHQL